MSAHRPGQRLTEMRDVDAARRHGISAPADVDTGESYDGEDALFPVESRLEHGGKPVTGACPHCRGVVVGDANGLGGTACVLCGTQITGRWS